ncbi:MAG: T9SS type A sorting domain-containing protein [Flavobacteriales bacterium]|nr:T9SS type A sorting domain-containing protein [Flavobacteriales bacterium]
MKQNLPTSGFSFLLFFLLISSLVATANTYYWVGGKGQWMAGSATFWSNASGGAPGAGPPTAADTVVFDAGSFAQAGDTIFISGNVHAAKVIWSGVSNFPVFSQAVTDTLFIGGSFFIDPNMALDMHGTIVFNGLSGTNFIHTNGKLLDADILFAGDAQWHLSSDLESQKTIILRQGGFHTKGYYLRCNVFDGHGLQSLIRTLTLDTSLVRITETWDMTQTAGLTFDPGTSLIEVVRIPGQGNFRGGGLAYHDVTFYATQLTVTGSNQYHFLKLDTGTVTIPASAAQSFSTLESQNPGVKTTIQSSSSTKAQLVSLSGKRTCLLGMNFSNIAFSGGSCYAKNSGQSNCTGVTIAPCPAPLSATISNKVNVTCNGGNNGSVTVSASGGTMPYSYLWDDAQQQTTNKATGLTAGTYTVRVIDVDKDTVWATATLNEPTAIAHIFAETQASCQSSCNGSLMVNVTGGSVPYTYMWSDPDGQTTQTASNLCAGDYTVSVTDAIGCMVSFNYGLTSTGADPKLSGQVNYSGGGASGLKVRLLKFKTGGVMPAVDSVYTDGSGNYSFPAVPSGNYILHVRTDTTLYPQTVSTFHDTVFRWSDAIQFTVDCDDSTSKDITLVEFPPQNGDGKLSGTVVRRGPNKKGETNVIFGDPIPDVDIVIRSKPAGMMKGETKTNGSGYYEFSNIEPGDYDLWVDIPGLPMDSTWEVSVTASDTIFTQMDFVVDSNAIDIPDDITTSLPPMPSSGVVLQAFPNPFSSNTTLIYRLPESAQVRLEIVDMVGRTVSLVDEGFRQKGDHKQTINSGQAGMIPGVYFARITVDGNVSVTRLLLIE